jgi:hypothetical protein
MTTIFNRRSQDDIMPVANRSQNDTKRPGSAGALFLYLHYTGVWVLWKVTKSVTMKNPYVTACVLLLDSAQHVKK